MNLSDFFKTLIDQVLGVIKAVGSDNNKLASVIDGLKNIFADIFNKKDAE